MVLLLASQLAACVAVSAKGLPLSARYSLVETYQGRIFVVDKPTKSALPVRILTEGEEIEWGGVQATLSRRIMLTSRRLVTPIRAASGRVRRIWN